MPAHTNGVPQWPKSAATDGKPVDKSIFKRILHVCLKAQWIVGGSCAVVAILYPHVEVYGFLAGAFCNAFLSKGLKRIIRQERPLYAVAAEHLAEGEGAIPAAAHLAQVAASAVAATAVDAAVFAADELGVPHPSPTPILSALPVPMDRDLGHGMPSSHAMSLFYFATYLALASRNVYLGRRHYDEGGVKPHPVVLLLRRILPDWMEESWDDGYGRYIFTGIMFTLVAFECYTRIRRRYHTWQQICVGATLGSMVGYVHYTHMMPMIREASKDVPPLAERSTTFISCFTIGMTLLAALTLGQGCSNFARAKRSSNLIFTALVVLFLVCSSERNTQRVAKSIIRSLVGSFRRAKAS